MRHSCGLFVPATGRLAVLLLPLLSGLTTGAHAQYTWTGAGSTNNWSNAANWSTAVPVSAASTTLDFTKTATTSNNDIADPFTLNSVSFDVTSSVFNISGGALNFVSNSGTTPTLNQNSAAAITLSNNLTLTNDLTITGSGKGTITLSGAISGAGQLVISANATVNPNTWVAGTPDPGAFTTIISNTNNSYTGADTTYGTTYIAGGVLQLGANNALPIGSSSSSVDLTVSGVEADSTFDLHGFNQTLNSIYLGDIQNANSMYATTIMDSSTGSKGTLTLNGDISFDGGYQTIAPAAVISCNLSLASDNHNIFNPNGNIASTGYDVVISGLISGAGGLTTNSGTNVVLSHANNTYTGPTVIEESNLYLDAANALSIKNAVTVGNGSSLYLYIASDAYPQAGTTAGSFNQSIGSLTSGNFGATIQIYLGHAVLTIGNDNTSTTFSGLISDNDNDNTGSTDTSLVGGSIVKVGTGTLTLSGDNSNTNDNSTPYTGNTTVQDGTLQLGANGALPPTTSLIMQGGTFQTGAFSDTIGNLTSSGGSAIVNSGSTLTVSNVTNSGGNVVINSGGTLTSTGAYNQSAGVTQVDGALNLKNNSTLQLTGGQLVGTGTVASTVTAGTITINNNGGIVSPGDVLSGSPTGTLNIKGNYTQTSTGTLQVNLGGMGQGTSYDLLTVLDKASLAGTLDVNLVNNFVPTVGETFDFLTYGSLSGGFTTISSLNSGYSYSVSYNSVTDTALLTVLTVGVPETSTLLSAGLMLGTGGLLLLRKRRA